MKGICKYIRPVHLLLLMLLVSVIALSSASVSKYVMDLGEVGNFTLDVEPSSTLPTANEFRTSIYNAKNQAGKGDIIRIVFDRWDPVSGYQNNTYGSVNITPADWNSGYKVDAFGGIHTFVFANPDRSNTATAYVLSEKDIVAPANSDSLFSGSYATFKKIEEIVFNNFHLPDTSVYSAEKIFYDCAALKELDLSFWADHEGKFMLTDAFYQCTQLTRLDLSGVDFSKCSKESFSGNTFRNMQNLEMLDISHTTWSGGLMEWMYSATYTQVIDVTGIKTERVTQIDDLFNSWTKLKEIKGFSDFNTVNLESFEQTFVNCKSLPNTYFDQFAACLENGNKVTKCYEGFNSCTNLTADTAQRILNALGGNELTSMYGLFNLCTGIKGEIDISVLKTAKVTDMRNVFKGCTGITSLNLSGLNTGSVKNMSSMFEGCTGLTELDLSGLNIKNVTNVRKLFSGCTKLTTVYVANNWALNESVFTEYDHATAPFYNRGSAGMFNGCTSLVGGAGTVYNANNTNATYAHIDGGTENPGYFTAKVVN